jgi:N6-adenosine-specific RNA methylase IME4
MSESQQTVVPLRQCDVDRSRVSPMAFHPLANLFPLMEGAEFAALVDDIRVNGLHEPIVVHDGQVLDGRNRYRACEELGIDSAMRVHDGSDPLAFVISANLQRRHLNESQRAMVAARIATMGEGRPNKTAEISAVSQTSAAALLHSSRGSVQNASAVLGKAEPEIVDAVDRGEIAVSTAAKVAELPPETQREIAAEPKTAKHAVKRYRRAERVTELAAKTIVASEQLGTKLYGVIYADPPWRFEPWSRETGQDRAADNHYPTLTLEAITAIVPPAAEDCVLFLWATIPMLPEAIEVMRAWGFTYRSAVVWAKDRVGTGYWFRNTAELLMVGVRGDVPAPALGTQYESIIEARAGAHSAKPNGFAEMIEELFPSVPCLEMFARGPRLGWDTWGNEAP